LCPAQCGLASTGITADEYKALFLVNAIEKMVQGLPVLLTEKEKPGVRSQPERFFTEAKKL